MHRSFGFHKKLKKRREKNVAFFKRMEKNEVPNQEKKAICSFKKSDSLFSKEQIPKTGSTQRWGDIVEIHG